MIKVVCNRFAFATTIGIVSGNPRHDRRAAAIIDAVKAQSKEPINFVGVIGDSYANKLTKQYASSQVAKNDEIVVTRNYDEVVQDSSVTPYRIYTHLKNRQLINTLKNNNFFEDLYEQQSPAVITVGNFSIISRVFETLNKLYSAKGAEKPLRLGFDLLIDSRTSQNENILDFMYYNLPRIPDNFSKYTFPSLCIAYDGLFKAFQFLQKHRSDGQGFKHSEFSMEVDQLVRKARVQYRKNKGFTEDQYLMILAPGNENSEIDFCFKKFAAALKGFSTHDRIKTISKDFFKVLVLLPEDPKTAEAIKAKIGSLGSDFNVSVVENSEKYGAMCGADYAVLHNGEITVEAAACQLPAVVINSMSNYHAYISYLYNGHESPLNISTGYHAYEEMLGSWSVVPLKLTNSMVDHLERPKLRYNYVKLYREEILKMLMLNGRNPELNLSQTGIEAAASDILKKVELRKSLVSQSPLNRYERKEKLQLV